MKKIELTVVAVFALILVSCKKDRVCTCSGTTTYYTGATLTYSSSVTYKKVTKREGRIFCGAGGSKGTHTYSSGTNTFDETCTLK
ncbi:MAG: hypothetical protein ACXVC6_15090 [Bacteroidia bacterium]